MHCSQPAADLIDTPGVLPIAGRADFEGAPYPQAPVFS